MKKKKIKSKIVKEKEENIKKKYDEQFENKKKYEKTKKFRNR